MPLPPDPKEINTIAMRGRITMAGDVRWDWKEVRTTFPPGHSVERIVHATKKELSSPARGMLWYIGDQINVLFRANWTSLGAGVISTHITYTPLSLKEVRKSDTERYDATCWRLSEDDF